MSDIEVAILVGRQQRRANIANKDEIADRNVSSVRKLGRHTTLSIQVIIKIKEASQDKHVGMPCRKNENVSNLEFLSQQAHAGLGLGGRQTDLIEEALSEREQVPLIGGQILARFQLGRIHLVE